MSSWNRTFMEIAEIVAKRSTCGKRQTAALIVRDERIISMGYNGAPAGMPHCVDLAIPAEIHYEWSRLHEVHAEINAIAYSARVGVPCQDAEMYTLLAPCSACAFAIVAAGIKKINYKLSYRDTNGLQILEKCGVKIVLLP